MTRRTALTLAEEQVERGDATAEAVLLVPVVFLTLLFGVQFAALLHAGSVATAAAAQGAAAAAAHGSGLVDGERAATLTAVELDATLSDKPVVSFDYRDVRVRVTVKVPEIVPGFPGRVTRTATEAREMFAGEGER